LRNAKKGSVCFKNYLRGLSPSEPEKVVHFSDLNSNYFLYEERHEKPKASKELRTNQNEVYGNLTTEEALGEAQRCFSCGMCDYCDNCYLFCPDGSIVKQENGQINIIDYEYCKGCGICAKECPIGMIEMEKEE
jgi:2-oxoacid:acceptor oxidoreductase delta subunit (pyruvate/2-ketoisovalerate family)